jgi:2-polyprenyl-6-methoxyphenol hydroxylase-like FAD-dependent oxidoreductase
VYCDLRDPWLRAFRAAPRQTLLTSLPGLGRLLGAFEMAGDIKIRPADLYVSRNERRPGVVLLGDAFATSCPAAGTGLNKVFTDVVRLCHIHLPRWLYDDRTKRACDAHSLSKARYLRSLSTDAALPWRIRRWSRSVGHMGAAVLRQTRERLPIKPAYPEQNPYGRNTAGPSAPF